MHVALFITCLADGFFPRSGIAVTRVLEHLGHDVSFPAGQTCCGQPMFNGGMHHDARGLARKMIGDFGACDAVVTPSGSCCAMVREHYADLFPEGTADRAHARTLALRTYEFAELLVDVLDVDLAALGARWVGRAAIHESCHLRGIEGAGRAARLAAGIEGLEVEDVGETCCGFGGVFAVKYPSISASMVNEKVAAIRASGRTTVICSDGGCTMNIAGACRRDGLQARFLSVAEIVAESLGLLEREPVA